jgi:serine/threonine protein kinase
VGGDDAAPYLVMERLHGKPLGARIAEGPLPEPEAVRLVLAAARGVAAAHQEGVIHRDLKPDNIFLTDSASGDYVPKVLDFGISRIIAPSEKLDSLTRSGTILGTPAYMPYEQLRGGGEVDARADVYALGVILYEALSGRRPFEANNLHDLVLRMANEEPTPLAKVQPNTSRHVRAVVRRCLLRAPELRYRDASELVAALERVLAAPDDTEDTPGQGTAARRRWWLAALLTVLLALLGWGALALYAPDAELAEVPEKNPSAAPKAAATPEPAPAQPGAPPPSAPAAPGEPSATPAHMAVEPRAPTQATKRPSGAARQAPAKQDKFERARELRPDDF